MKNAIANMATKLLNKYTPGRPPASMEPSQTDQERTIIGKLLKYKRWSIGSANIRVPKQFISAWFLSDKFLYIISILTCPLWRSVYPAPNKNAVAWNQIYNSCIQINPIENTYLNKTTTATFKTRQIIIQPTNTPNNSDILSINLVIKSIKVYNFYR